MSDPTPPTNNPQPPGKKLAIFGGLAVLLAAALLIPAVRHAVFGFFIKDEKRLQSVLELARAAITAELANQPLPGMKPAAPDVHIVPTGLTNFQQRATWHRTPEGSDAFPSRCSAR